MAELKVDIIGDASGLTNSVNKATQSLKQMDKAADGVSGNVTAVGKSVNSAAKPMKDLRNTSKKTGASFLEFTRIIGDAPYGIRGVANNIQQLAFTMGLGGPAILAITAITAALDYFTNRTDKAAEEVETLGDKANEAADKLDPFAKAMAEGANAAATETAQLEGLFGVVNDTTRSIDERRAAVNSLQELFPDYFGDLKDEEILTGKAADAYAALSRSIVASAQARAAQSELDTAVGQIRANSALIDQEQAKLDNINKRIKSERAAQNLAMEAAKAGSEIGRGEVAAREQRISKLISERAKIQRPITQAKLENIRLNGNILKLEKEITDQTIAKSKAEAGYVEQAKKDEKAARNTRKAIKDIATDSLKITPPIVEGLNKAAQDFEKGLTRAISRAARQLQDEDFAEVFRAAQLGPSGITVQPDLRGPGVAPRRVTPELDPTFGSEFVKLLEKNLNRVAQRFGRNMTNTFRQLQSEGKFTFRNILSTLAEGLNKALGNAVSSIAGSVGASLGKTVGESVTSSIGGVVGKVLGPGLGTLVGGVITGLGSLIGGLFGRGKRRREAEKQAKIEEQQLAEQKKMAKELERQSALAYTSSIIGKMLPGFGTVSNIDINQQGQLTAKVDGKDLLFVLNRAESASKRGI